MGLLREPEKHHLSHKKIYQRKETDYEKKNYLSADNVRRRSLRLLRTVVVSRRRGLGNFGQSEIQAEL